ncbi:MAG TPA: hypothetical protein VNC14_10555, partial [Lapillicoccus sp.]|nr:hypothetical protein [Lapillicoccus sp.]
MRRRIPGPPEETEAGQQTRPSDRDGRIGAFSGDRRKLTPGGPLHPVLEGDHDSFGVDAAAVRQQVPGRLEQRAVPPQQQDD